MVGYIVLSSSCLVLIITERHDPQQQDDFREQAHELLQTVLDKNNEADDRRVSSLSYPTMRGNSLIGPRSRSLSSLLLAR